MGEIVPGKITYLCSACWQEWHEGTPCKVVPLVTKFRICAPRCYHD